MNKFAGAFLVVLSTALSFSALAQERDPFDPYVKQGTSSGGSKVVEPVRSTVATSASGVSNHPVKSFKVIGVIVGRDKSMAVLRGPDNLDYFVSKGDEVGSERGKIQEVTVEDIKVNIADKELVTLVVGNKMVVPSGGANVVQETP